MGAGDDENNNDWDEAAPTVLDVSLSEPVTAPHDVKQLPGYEIGRRSGREEKAKVCYEEGQEDAIGALRSLMLESGASNDEADATIRRLRGRLTRL